MISDTDCGLRNLWTGVRYAGAYWTDAYNRLWLFGGKNAADTPLNDLWVCDPDDNFKWTWKSGSSTPGTIFWCQISS
jgi:hypothetical protein